MDADGVVSLEDLDNPGSQDADYAPAEQHDGTAASKKVLLFGWFQVTFSFLDLLLGLSRSILWLFHS